MNDNWYNDPDVACPVCKHSVYHRNSDGSQRPYTVDYRYTEFLPGMEFHKDCFDDPRVAESRRIVNSAYHTAKSQF